LHSITESGYALATLSPGRNATERREWPRCVASVEMMGREERGKAGGRDVGGAKWKKRKRRHATRHARRHTFSVGRVPALGRPASDAAPLKRHESVLTSSIPLSTKKREASVSEFKQ